MVVNECNVATRIDTSESLGTYVNDDVECLDSDTILDQIKDITVMSKVMTQYVFDPLQY